MVGMLESGFRVVSQISGAAFRDIALSSFRSYGGLICSSGGVGFTDVVIDGNAGAVRLVQVSGEPPATHDDLPIAPIPFDQFTAGTYKEVFDFLSWPLATGSPARQRVKAIDGDAVAIGLGLDAGDDLAVFAGFTTNHLNINGAARDFLVAINGDVLTGDFVRNFFFFPPAGLVVPMLTGPVPSVKSFSISGDNQQPGPFLWRQPWQFRLDVELTIGSDGSEVDIYGTAWLEAPGDGGLDIHVSVPPAQIDPSYWDDAWPFATFSTAERNTTATLMAFIGAESLRLSWGAAKTTLSARPDLVRVTAVGEAVGRIFDPGLLILPTGDPTPAFYCEGLDVTPEGVIVYGSVRRTATAPHLVVVPQTLTFTERLASACDGAAEPEFDTQTVQLRNFGQGPLHLCRHDTQVSGPDAARFDAYVTEKPGEQHAEDYITVAPGDFGRLIVGYHGPRGVNSSATATVVTSDLSRPRYPVELRALSGAPNFAVDPPALSVRRANNPMGRPVVRIANCQPQPVRENAAEFRVINLGAVPIHICSLELNDPDGVFVIPFFQRVVEPGSTDYFAVLFFPKEAGHTYFAVCTLTFAGGQQYVLQIDGRVEVLPQPGEPGEWIDLGAGRGCFVLEGLCRARGHYTPVADPGVLPVVETTVSGLPPDAGLIMQDGEGRVHVNDMSGLPDRSHALAYTPNPDGGALPGDPCRGEIPGVGPVGPDPGPDPIMVDVEGWLIRPEGKPFEVDMDRLMIAGKLPRLARPDGLWTVDPEREKLVPLKLAQRLDRIDGLAIGRGRAAILAGDRLSLHDAESDEIGAHRAEARLDRPASGVLLRGRYLLIADDGGVAVFVEQGRELRQTARATLPGGVRALRNISGGVVALGDNLLTFIALGKEGTARIATTLKLAEASSLSAYRSHILVAGENAVRAYGIVEGRLRHLADYPLGHWSLSYLPGGADDILLKRVDAGHLQRCRIERHEFDRVKFAEAFKLQYRPKPPGRF